MQIRIVDLLGNVVSESNNVGTNNYYNLASFEAGIYFAQVTHNGVTYTTKIVKN
ncbi:MAG: T9SS type A sorting domain-containing protein [Bacteroidia bacterium]